MKKKNVINLIKYHTEENELQFKNESIEIARYFDSIGDYQLAEYIMGLVSGTNTFIPQGADFNSTFLNRIEVNTSSLPLPQIIADDIKGIINAVNHAVGINKFLFEGAPGTGKTETVKQIARILDRSLYMVNFSELIDSKMGQTAKNIVTIFTEINHMPKPTNLLILFDEIDAIALDRVNSNDLREMGRVTSTILKELDQLNEDIVLIATTNLFDKFDKALTRRFDSIINFNRYSKEDLLDIATSILNEQLKTFTKAGRNIRLFKKIVKNMVELPYPGELQNLIKTSLAFSNPDEPLDYLRKLAQNITTSSNIPELKTLHDLGFTMREMEILTGISRSQISRVLKGDINE